jgi:prepilin-type N-terminal cleavage/methylation domain-containing protein
MMKSSATHSLRVRSCRSAFTLLEMLVVVGLMAIVAVTVLPGLSDDTRLRLMAASAVLRSDIELTQIMNISQPADPVVIQFDPDTNSYWIAPAKDRSTPILREQSGEPYVVTFGSGRASAAPGVTMALVNVIASALEFNSQGGLAAFTNTPTIELQLGPQAIRLDVHPTTGRISETFGVPSSMESDGEADEGDDIAESTPIINVVED